MGRGAGRAAARARALRRSASARRRVRAALSLQLLAAYVVLEIVLSATPGPAVLTIVSQALRHGWRRSLCGALGILSGNALYFLLSALGVGAFLAASPRLAGALRWGGIAVLAFTALRMLLRPRQGDADSGLAEEAAVASVGGSPRELYVQALTTQLANPKTIVFFVSLLAPFIDPAAPWPAWLQILVLAVTSLVLELPILAAYGFAASHGRRLLPAGSRGRAWEGRIAGGCLLCAAAWLALR